MAINADVHVPHGSSHGTIQADKVLKSHIGAGTDVTDISDQDNT